MTGRIRKIGQINASDFATIVVVRGHVEKIMWSPFPPSSLDGIVGIISHLIFARFRKEITIMRSYSLLLEDGSGEIIYRGLKGAKDKDAIKIGEDLIACGVVKISEKNPYLYFLKKKSYPSFIIRPSRLGHGGAGKEREKAFFMNLKNEFPEIFSAWKDIAELAK